MSKIDHFSDILYIGLVKRDRLRKRRDITTFTKIHYDIHCFWHFISFACKIYILYTSG